MKTQTSKKSKKFIFKVLFGFLLLLFLNSSCSSPSKYLGQSIKFELKYSDSCATTTDTRVVSDSFTFAGVKITYGCISVFREYTDGVINIDNDSGTPVKLSFNDVSGENSLVLTHKTLFDGGWTVYTPKRRGITGEILFLPNDTSYYEEDFTVNFSEFSCNSDADRTALARTTVAKLGVYITAECKENLYIPEPRIGTRFSNYSGAQVLTPTKRFVLDSGKQVVFDEMTGTRNFRIRYPLQFFRESK